MIIYVVKPGDTLQSIGKMYNLDYKNIAKYNELSLDKPLVEGQSIIISNQNVNKIKSIVVNGYVFPGIELSSLEKILPNLTFLSIFSYHIKEDGNLETINDNYLIDLSLKNTVVPIMTLTNINKAIGRFDSNLIHKILINNDLQSKLINNITKTLESKKYQGINIDFEYIYPEDKKAFINFLNKLRITTKDKYLLNISVAPKTSSNQKGLLYEAHDYKEIGKLADFVIIMTYEWGYTKGPAMAVAPINKVEQVINYAVSEIDSQKILMGIPNYGYDWTLPFIEGSSAKSINNVEAIDLARNYNTNILFDDVSKSPFFYYFDKEGKKHEVWFEDIRSINSKLNLIITYNLAGPSYWTINRPFPQNYLFLNTLFYIEKNNKKS